MTEFQSEQVYSVAQTGPDGYVDYVEVFTSKDAAVEHAEDIGSAYVVRGTQMWNEPLGQIEESTRESKYWYYR